ncbi:hypothetical protein DVDV_0097 [Desulfovibrio sp. DV]|uniref:helix-turn-helix domain-containing protein n=1 Tax=Desulfovibrio sp. DV TaxID=1844708 RepID=UPI00094B7DF2|nr:helix-turn-helix domain-containing protein [Desulfovibrio sp. DV]OLN31309.1 hypothetical protein DVDV_0097 [Desulfovibrio sp. DV]
MRQTNLPHDRTAHGPLLNVKQVMERLDCSKTFVYDLIKSQQLAHVRLGTVKGLRVPEKSLKLYIRKKEAAAKSGVES